MSMKVTLTHADAFEKSGIPTVKSMKVRSIMNVNLSGLGRIFFSRIQMERLWRMSGDEIWWMFRNQRVIGL